METLYFKLSSFGQIAKVIESSVNVLLKKPAQSLMFSLFGII
jgi:hypothetical protein